MLESNVFKGKTVLITGHTGFKGSWLSIWLTRLGARVVGASIDIVSEPSNFSASKIERILDDRRVDITDLNSRDQNLLMEEICAKSFLFNWGRDKILISLSDCFTSAESLFSSTALTSLGIKLWVLKK